MTRSSALARPAPRIEPQAAPVVYSRAPRGGYQDAAGGGWAGLAGTLCVYALVAAALLFSLSTHFAAPPPPAALTVVDMSPPASPPQTPPRPRDAPRPLERKATPPEPIKTPPPPEVKVAISPLTVPAPVLAPPPVDPAPRQAETAAPKTAPAPPAPRLASNGPDTWEGRVLLQLSRKRHYPLGAMARHEQGVPYIRFVMDRQGKVLAVSLERSSGMADLDREALALPRRAQPLPKPPEDRPGDTLELVVPVEFFMR